MRVHPRTVRECASSACVSPCTWCHPAATNCTRRCTLGEEVRFCTRRSNVTLRSLTPLIHNAMVVNPEPNPRLLSNHGGEVVPRRSCSWRSQRSSESDARNPDMLCSNTITQRIHAFAKAIWQRRHAFRGASHHAVAVHLRFQPVRHCRGQGQG